MLKLNIQLFADGGTLVIGTDLDTTTLEKKLKEEQRQLSRFEKENEKLFQKKQELEIKLKVSTEEANAKIEDLKRRYKQDLEQFREAKIDVVPRDSKIYQGYKAELEEIYAEYNKQLQPLNEINKKIKENSEAQAQVKKQTQQTNLELGKVKALNSIKGSVDDIGKSMKNVVSNVARWGLAIFGIRSAYMAIRRAISLVSSENEGVANKIQIMKSAIAEALLPLVQTILNYVSKLMVYINHIYQSLTGKALFDFDKAWQKAKNNAKSVEKSAKETRKTIAGFDEMNILGDNTTASGGAGGTGTTEKLENPFEGWQNFKIPAWVEKIGKLAQFAADNWREFAGMLSLAGVAIGLITGQYGLAIASFIGYLVTQIPQLIDDIKILTGSNSLLEVGLKTLFAVLVPQIGIPYMLADAYTDLTTETGSATKATQDLKEAQINLKKAQTDLKNSTNKYKTALENAKNAEKELKEAQEKTGISAEELFEQVKQGKISYRDMNEQQKRVYEAYLINIDAQKELKTATDNLTTAEENLKTATKKEEEATLTDALAKQRAKGDYDGYKKSVVDAYNEGKISAGKARDYIEQACQDMSDANAKTFTKDLPSDIKSGLNPDKYKNAFTKLKNAWNKFIEGLASNIGLSISAKGIASGAASGVGKHAKGAIIYSSVPKLATGGIINQPGRGVPIAYGGERGSEAVVPLTDSQQMALLGEAIGKYITINANITNTMNGRVISKELQKINNESDFAFNR